MADKPGFVKINHLSETIIANRLKRITTTSKFKRVTYDFFQLNVSLLQVGFTCSQLSPTKIVSSYLTRFTLT